MRRYGVLGAIQRPDVGPRREVLRALSRSPTATLRSGFSPDRSGRHRQDPALSPLCARRRWRLAEWRAKPGGTGHARDRHLQICCAVVGSRAGTLLVLESVEHPTLPTSELPGLPSRRLPPLGYRVLITSRLATLPGCIHLELEILSRGNARRLLLQASDRSVESQQYQAILNDLGRLVGRLPLALRLGVSILLSGAVVLSALEVATGAGINHFGRSTTTPLQRRHGGAYWAMQLGGGNE